MIEEKFENSDRDLKILENENVLDEFARTEIFQTRKLKNLQMDVFSGLSEFGKKLELQKNIQNQVLQKQKALNQKVQDLEKQKEFIEKREHQRVEDLNRQLTDLSLRLSEST